jgi:hypothetical protein
MISKDEIKVAALKWWKQVLQSSLENGSLFPKEIERFGRVKANQTLKDFEAIRNGLIDLRENSKEKKGYGYAVVWESINSQRIGKNEFPKKIQFDELIDYLKFVGKEKEFEIFQKCSAKIINEIPHLRDWVYQNPIQVIENHKNWDSLLNVCKYFMCTPKPQLYIRQLPIQVHTKFIEENSSLISSLLEFLIPERIETNEIKFEKRLGLKIDEPLIRIRFLDSQLCIFPQITDISIPLSEFELLEIGCNKILITENKMNFLTLPNLTSTIALWSGGGFNVKYLSQIEWIKAIEVYYWGDLDTHGFQILNQVKSYFPQTKSVMMDKLTFDENTDYVVSGSVTGNYRLDYLNQEELELYEYLKHNNFRLEQERISQEFSENYLRRKILIHFGDNTLI